MLDPHPRTKRADAASGPGINSLINAANKNDRFKLLEDDAVLSANLTNAIHPIFHQLKGNCHLRLALQLASHFILHDRLLEFFVPLLYGRQLHDLRSMKKYLFDPLTHASQPRQAQLLLGVRQALQCLADHLDVSFVAPSERRVYARTIIDEATPALTSICCLKFQGKVSPKIEVSDKFLQFYEDPDGYVKASRCAQYRHDFLLATTLVHEVVHAVGVMRRGDILEPHYRPDYPETEWGYAWENFMFGSIINPQDKNRSGTHLLMRRIWANADTENDKGGKEYCDVSMSWIGQWFRSETWSIIAENGPTAIAPPITHLKIQGSVVFCDTPAVRKDIADLYKSWHLDQRSPQTVWYKERTQAELQKSILPIPPRIRSQPEPSTIRDLLSSTKTNSGKKAPYSTAGERPSPMAAPLISVYRKSSNYGVERKRRADTDGDNDYSPMPTKRKR
ncbi:hypothetical protein C7974DRAFT_303400 [Boeremia exigua]|uniref:uncharacterized protein n=1 Tax=Boeremia exigua TaxID=749465 RepID=UPI001E8DA287|nr:uncharacterized protein C7974DRAFT_303400 [Boeremia exigua]KAH6642389.1 hypothetical protein C7974DRAFT_303400 [Boeremia exigua]